MASWHDNLPEDVLDGTRPMTEDDVWDAIALTHDMDVSEIADGDLAEWL